MIRPDSCMTTSAFKDYKRIICSNRTGIYWIAVDLIFELRHVISNNVVF